MVLVYQKGIEKRPLQRSSKDYYPSTTNTITLKPSLHHLHFTIYTKLEKTRTDKMNQIIRVRAHVWLVKILFKIFVTETSWSLTFIQTR